MAVACSNVVPTRKSKTVCSVTVPQDADQVPMGTGIAVLAALGGAYLVAKKRREE